MCLIQGRKIIAVFVTKDLQRRKKQVRSEMVLWRQATKAQAIPVVCCAIEVLLQQGEKRTNSQNLPLAST